MTELVRDQLNGTPGDDLSTANPAWVRQPGAAGTLLIAPDGQSACGTTSTNTASYIRSDVVPPNPDYFVYVDASFLDSLSNAAAVGVTGRASSSAFTHYQFRFVASVNAPNGVWQLRRIVNNTATLLASMAGTFAAGQSTNIGIGTSGTQVSAYLDKVLVLGPSTSTINDTGFGGMIATNAPASRVRMDNFVMDDGLTAVSGVSAALSWVDPDDVAMLSGLLTDRADIASTDPADTMLIAAAVTNRAALQWIDPADGAALVGAVDAPAPVGADAALAWADAPDIATLVGKLSNRAVISFSEPEDMWALTGAAAQPAPLTGTLRLNALAHDLRTKTIHFSN